MHKMKNIIFDFGQVIVRFDEEYMTSRYVKDKADCKLVKDVVFDRLYWDRFDDGSLTTTEAKKMMCKRLPQELHQQAVKVLDYWYYDLEFIGGMKELITDLKQSGKRLYLLSNIGVDFAKNYNKVPELCELFSFFDGLVFSGALHIVKPGCQIFEHLLNTYNLNPNECVFVDDRQINIDGAEKAGIKGILFDGDVKALRQQIL